MTGTVKNETTGTDVEQGTKDPFKKEYLSIHLFGASGVCVCAHVSLGPCTLQDWCVDQGTIYRSWFSSCIAWVLKVECRPSGLMAGAFMCKSILLALHRILYVRVKSTRREEETGPPAGKEITRDNMKVFF